MIIAVEDIRKYREIALNTQKNRVEIFIRETEELDIVPLLGVDEYDRLANRMNIPNWLTPRRCCLTVARGLTDAVSDTASPDWLQPRHIWSLLVSYAHTRYR